MDAPVLVCEAHGLGDLSDQVDASFQRQRVLPPMNKVIKTLGVGFLSAGAGGPCVDQAAPRATPRHAGMRFCPAEMQAVLGDIADALIEQGVGAAEVAEVLRLFRVISGQQAETSLSRNATGNESGTRAL